MYTWSACSNPPIVASTRVCRFSGQSETSSRGGRRAGDEHSFVRLYRTETERLLCRARSKRNVVRYCIGAAGMLLPIRLQTAKNKLKQSSDFSSAICGNSSARTGCVQRRSDGQADVEVIGIETTDCRTLRWDSEGVLSEAVRSIEVHPSDSSCSRSCSRPCSRSDNA